MEKTIKISYPLNINASSFELLSKIQNEIIDTSADRIILDFTNCKFCNSIFTSFLGALAHIAIAFGKTIVYMTHKNSALNKYFRSSGLYNHITDDEKDYTNHNAIPFREINMEDDMIIDYIHNILNLAPIKLTAQCRQLLFKNIYEIFNNSADHSRAQHGVYGCGHWMPNKKQLIFSVYDTGIGIPALVKERIDNTMTSEEALRWALKLGNSTKQLKQGTPRGLGLFDLSTLIRLNDGALNIFTNDLYYNYANGETIHRLEQPIIGTLIGITIIADYDHIYTTK